MATKGKLATVETEPGTDTGSNFVFINGKMDVEYN